MALIKIKKLNSNAQLPLYKSDLDAGMDLYYPGETVYLYPQHTVLLDTGLAFEIPEGWWIQLQTRSGMAVKGLVVGGGIIDNSYRGPIKIALTNMGLDAYQIRSGDRIAQAVLRKHEPIQMEEIPEFSNETDRGDKGFGSSGR